MPMCMLKNRDSGNESIGRYCKRDIVQHDTADRSNALVMIVVRKEERREAARSGNKIMLRQTILSMVSLEDHASVWLWKHLTTLGYI